MVGDDEGWERRFPSLHEESLHRGRREGVGRVTGLEGHAALAAKLDQLGQRRTHLFHRNRVFQGVGSGWSLARMKDNRWTKRCTEWQPRRGKRSRGRPSRRWQDDITEKEGTTWIRKATDRRQWKTLMEGYILQWLDKA